MIPPFLATAAGKAAVSLIGVAVIAGAIYAYNARQQAIGYNEATTEFHAQIQEQTEQVQAYDANQSAQRLQDVERTIAEKDKFNAQLILETRSYAAENARLKAALNASAPTTPEVIHEVQYIETMVEREATCLVPDDLVHRVDHLARVLNEIPYDRVSNTPETVSESPLQRPASVTCAALVERVEVLTARLGNSMIEHRGLSEFVLGQYDNYQRFMQAHQEGAP